MDSFSQNSKLSSECRWKRWKGFSGLGSFVLGLFYPGSNQTNRHLNWRPIQTDWPRFRREMRTIGTAAIFRALSTVFERRS